MFYDRLKGLCEERGITITRLIKELHMSTGNLSKWKNGNIPKSDTIKTLSEYFCISADYLVGNDIQDEKSITLPDDFTLTLTSDEKWFILKLRQLDKDGKAIVEGVLVSEVRKVENREKEMVSVG